MVEAPADPAQVVKCGKGDRKAKALLMGFIVDEYIHWMCVKGNESARAMWKSLEDAFAKKSAGRQTLISKQNARLPLKDGESVRGNLLRIENLVLQLRMTGSKF